MKISYIIGMTKKYGLKGLITKYRERSQDIIDQEYQKSFLQYMATEEELAIQRTEDFEYAPLISIVVPTYNTPEQLLNELIDSCLAQTYANWELVLADGSTTDSVKRVCDLAGDGRIRYLKLKKNGGISVNTNEGFRIAAGEFTGLLDHDDVLAPNALYEIVSRLNRDRDIDVFYSDEDKIDASGKNHSRPHFKLDFDLEMIRHYNYFCHFMVIRTALIRELGGLDPEYDGSQDYDLVLRLTEKTHRIYHIPKVLYHWRITENSTAGSSLSKDYAYNAGMRALQAYLDRMNIPGKAVAARGHGYYEIEYDSLGVNENNIDQYMDIADKASGAYDKIINAADGKDFILIYDSSKIHIPDKKTRLRMLQRCMIENTAQVGPRFSKNGRLTKDGINKLDTKCRDMFVGMPIDFQGYFCRAVIPQSVDKLSPLCKVIRRKQDISHKGKCILDNGISVKLK